MDWWSAVMRLLPGGRPGEAYRGAQRGEMARLGREQEVLRRRQGRQARRTDDLEARVRRLEDEVDVLRREFG